MPGFLDIVNLKTSPDRGVVSTLTPTPLPRVGEGNFFSASALFTPEIYHVAWLRHKLKKTTRLEKLNSLFF